MSNTKNWVSTLHKEVKQETDIYLSLSDLETCLSQLDGSTAMHLFEKYVLHQSDEFFRKFSDDKLLELYIKIDELSDQINLTYKSRTEIKSEPIMEETNHEPGGIQESHS